MESESTLFDNRKAGKSTPITLIRLRSGWGAMVWITYKFAQVEHNCGKKRRLIQSFEYRRNESLQAKPA